MSLADHILRRLRGHGRGFVFTAGDLLDLGTRAGIDQALARLVHADLIRRLDRGVYDLPRIHPTVGPLLPSADAVAGAVARQTDSHLKASGPLAANALGLSTQVPAHADYLTDGPSRTVRVGRLLVALRHAGRIDMLLPGTAAGLAIVALRYLGRDGITADVLRRLSLALSDADKALLLQVRRQLPGWLGQTVSELAPPVPGAMCSDKLPPCLQRSSSSPSPCTP